MADPHKEHNTEVGTAHQNGQKDIFPPFDPATFPSQLFWLAITFGALYLILSRVALPRIGEVLEERKDRIQDDLEKARSLQNQSEEASAQYDNALKEARAKATKIANENAEKLNAEIDAERQAVEEKIAQRGLEAEKEIQEAKATAFQEVDKIAAETTNSILQNLIGKKPTAAELKKVLTS